MLLSLPAEPLEGGLAGEVARTLPACAAWALALALHQAASAHIASFARARLADTAPPLDDLLHGALPDLRAWRLVPELLHLLPLVHLGALLALHVHDARAWRAARACAWAHATLLAMRGATFSVTLLPDASQACARSRFLGACHDLVFSGHVAAMVLAVALAHRHFQLPTMRGAALWGLAGVVSLAVVAVRNHYTLDVVASLILTPLVEHLWASHPRCVELTRAGGWPWLSPQRLPLPHKRLEEVTSARALVRDDDGTSPGAPATDPAVEPACGSGELACASSASPAASCAASARSRAQWHS